MEWMLDIQLGRRNLSPIQRIAIAEKYRSIYEKDAQKRLEEGRIKGGQIKSNNSTQNFVESKTSTNRSENETNAKLAKIANVNRETYRQAKRVLDSDNEDLKQRVLGNTNPVKLGRCFHFLNDWYGFHQGNGSNQHKQNEKVFNIAQSDEPSTQKELAQSYGITQQTMNNYMRMASMIPELEDLVDTGIVTKDTALISNNFGRRKNDPSKDRKALEIYVSLRGYKNGEVGNGGKKRVQNGLSKITLDEIAQELNMSKTNLKRALRIERNLTDSMKELLDTGEITKTFASDITNEFKIILDYTCNLLNNMLH